MTDHNDKSQTGPAVWADEPQPVPPPMRTFRVVLDTAFTDHASKDQYVDAHSVTCEGDSAHFYVYRPTPTSEGMVLAAFAIRMLRPYLDIEDITTQLADTPTTLN